MEHREFQIDLSVPVGVNHRLPRHLVQILFEAVVVLVRADEYDVHLAAGVRLPELLVEFGQFGGEGPARRAPVGREVETDDAARADPLDDVGD